jgi:hypothetical protein
MPNKMKNITENVMGQIRQGKLKMRPKIYFVIGSVLAFIGLVTSIATSVFAIGLVRFFLRSNGGWGALYRIERLILAFPWWILALAILGIVSGILFMRRYDISYKVNTKTAIILIISTAIVSGWLIDALGFNDLLAHRGPMQGMMRQHLQGKMH